MFIVTSGENINESIVVVVETSHFIKYHNYITVGDFLYTYALTSLLFFHPCYQGYPYAYLCTLGIFRSRRFSKYVLSYISFPDNYDPGKKSQSNPSSHDGITNKISILFYTCT